MSRAFNNALRIENIEDNATAILSASQVKTKYENVADKNELSDTEKTKLVNLDNGAYITPTFLNGWVNHSTTFQYAGYRKDETGTVHIKGLVKSGTAIVFTLPVGYRPAYAHIFVSYGNGIVERLDVSAAGDVRAYTASSAYFTLECSFKAEQ